MSIYVHSQIGIWVGWVKRLARSTALSPAFEGRDGKRCSGSILSKLRPSDRRVEGLTSALSEVRIIANVKRTPHQSSR